MSSPNMQPTVPPRLPLLSNGAEHLRDLIDNLRHLPVSQQRFIIRPLLATYSMEARLWCLAIELERNDGKLATANSILIKALTMHPEDPYLIYLRDTP
ncbi:hypothetical protein DM01DRAFT_1377810 [Hesseltinella vesiculosa]|uniref:Uncharacterized protein n=1 Tax=Hesseltinella vesiculosa TaxID=101127 RepID=A0A1X2G264_9FUNG|nr:hypothetical protein DM01DRAFT_1379054 [Hesseltinella vesiculosa]ORX46074.1 hypothetical protein DM01DRAFT_1377810 [Hesseltinella vesiculosa]